MATIKISTFESVVLHSGPARLRLKYGNAIVIDFPLTDSQYQYLEGGDGGDERGEAREDFIAMKFGKLFEMLAEWEAGADARSLTEGGI